MEITDHMVLFYFHKSEEMYEIERIQRFLQALAAKGYYVFADIESAALEPLWHEWTRDSADEAQVPAPWQAGVSPQALTMVEQFCAERQKFLMLQGYAVSTEVYSTGGRKLLGGFAWNLGFAEEQGMVYLGYLRHHFTVIADEWEAYAHLLEVIRLTYDLWHPLYGYTIDPRGGERDTPREEILAHTISYLYDINLFGPEIVEKLGRERVESAPAQIITSLDDGGLMLVPCENLLPDFLQYSYSQVAEHLGLAAPGIS
jgi:hypothetical protein